LLEVVRELLEVGVRGFQLREKDLAPGELLELARPIVELCRTQGARVLVNAAVEVAAECAADGVHLPGKAAAVEEVRRGSSLPLIVGCSVHSLEEAQERQAQGADFVVYSPIYPPASKPGYGPAAGPEGLRRVSSRLDIPVFALGGITPERVRECLGAGACGVAVMSGVMPPEKAGVRAREYLEQLNRAEENER